MDPDVQEKLLLRALATGKTISGAELAKQVGITRAAIWKRIVALRHLGLPIQAQAGKGYRLPWPLDLLDAQKIANHLGDKTGPQPDIYWELDSTQDEIARRESELEDLSVVLSESQLAGRGRRGKPWLSPPGLNIYLSCLKRFDKGVPALTGLPLVVGACIIRALEDVGITAVELKLPNDIVTDKGKLGGILITLHGEYEGPCHAHIGIGINVRLPESAKTQSLTDLAALGTQIPERNMLAAMLIKRIRMGLICFEKEGLAASVKGTQAAVRS